MHYDLLVIGDEREGVERALAAAEKGSRVAVVRSTEYPRLDILSQASSVVAERGDFNMDAWRDEAEKLCQWQLLVDDVEYDTLQIETFNGPARFVGPNSIEVPIGIDDLQVLSADEIVLACGTKSRRPAYFHCDDQFVLAVESLLTMSELPRSMVVVGGGRTGLTSAVLLARLGVEVTVVDEHLTLLELCGLFEPMFDDIQTLNIAFRLDDEVIGTEVRPDLQVAVRLGSGRSIVAERVLVCVGREGRTDELNLEAFGVGVDEHGRVWCDDNGWTWAEGVRAAGDVVGFHRIDREVQSTPSVKERSEFSRFPHFDFSFDKVKA